MSSTLTYFDKPERTTLAKVNGQHKAIAEDINIMQILEGFPELVLILNSNRQIVAFNSVAYHIFKVTDKKNILGKRAGEALNCIHHSDIPAGCGTTKFCQECGAAKAIRFTNETLKNSIDECRITSLLEDKEVFFDFEVHTKSVQFNDDNFTLFALRDISGEKRRQALERVFFHDVLNTSGAINGLAELLIEAEDDEDRNLLSTSLMESSRQLINEIMAQRELRNAEDGKLKTNPQSVRINNILKSAAELYFSHDAAKDKKIIVEYLDDGDDAEIITDKTHLVRSIGNLIKNALEATEKEGTIKLSAEISQNNLCFNIHNSSIIPEQYQLQIFQRSFSTKGGSGRGIGTYSVKLLVEQYLHGRVYFVSNKECGTVFTIELPVAISTD
ncbi:MAG: HAMP domain-containing histidine kinase [Candidatus Cloacimonetes bacterium]|nr:HAMP domain-containing histidine kinase [Candidatus Cloacimonadota bacterium]